MTDPLTAQRLAEARTALHKLLTGSLTAKVMVDGQSVEFSQANRADLEAYISRLEAEAGGRRSRGAISVYF